jgi:hypothetical protein
MEIAKCIRPIAMKKKYTCVLLIFTSFLLSAQSKDRKVVQTIVAELRLAMLDADKKNLNQLTSDSLSYGHSSGRVENKKEFIENIVSGKSDFISIDLTEYYIKDVKKILGILISAIKQE